MEEKIMKIIKAGNCDHRYVGGFSKTEIEIIEKSSEGKVLHLFSGKSNIGQVRVDFSQPEATHNQDVFEFLSNCDEQFDTVLLDPPYNENYAEKYNKLSGGNTTQFVIFANAKKTTELFNLIIGLNPNSIIIRSWNYYVPHGYYDSGSYLVYFGGYRKPIILMICKKI